MCSISSSMVGAGSGYTMNRLILSLRRSLPACSLTRTALAVSGSISEAMRYRESPHAVSPGEICPRPRSRTTCPCWLMDIEHAALPGIARASNAAESDDFRSTGAPDVGGTPGTPGVIGLAPPPQAPTDVARTMMASAVCKRIYLERLNGATPYSE